jgi:hypothetical protein
VHGVGEITPADSTVPLQCSDDSTVNVIYCHDLLGHLIILPKNWSLIHGAIRRKMRP